MLNQCTFIGNLGADPEVRNFPNGGRVCNLRLAVTEKWKSKEGEQKEKTEWISVVIQSDGLVGVAERFLRKGSKIYVQGKLSNRKWQDQSGQDRYTTEVQVGMRGALVMLDGKRDGQGGDGSRGHASGFSAPAAVAFGGDLDDEIPFCTRDSIW